MKPLGIGHDYSHCEGVKCKVKSRCTRYLLHKEAQEMGLTYVCYWVPIVKNGKCDWFWEYKKNER